MLKLNDDVTLVKNPANGSFVLTHGGSGHSVSFSASVAAALFDVDALDKLSNDHANVDDKPNAERDAKKVKEDKAKEDKDNDDKPTFSHSSPTKPVKHTN